MSLYDGIKDVAKVVQQADNIDLYKQLLDLGQQALDMQAEIGKLREENAELKKSRDLDSDIVYHVDPFVTRKSDEIPIKYCATCWGNGKRLITLQIRGIGNCRCPSCKANIIFTGLE